MGFAGGVMFMGSIEFWELLVRPLLQVADASLFSGYKPYELDSRRNTSSTHVSNDAAGKKFESDEQTLTMIQCALIFRPVRLIRN
jgi:hypothetical protein